jgi:hypothetical protein
MHTDIIRYILSFITEYYKLITLCRISKQFKEAISQLPHAYLQIDIGAINHFSVLSFPQLRNIRLVGFEDEFPKDIKFSNLCKNQYINIIIDKSLNVIVGSENVTFRNAITVFNLPYYFRYKISTNALFASKFYKRISHIEQLTLDTIVPNMIYPPRVSELIINITYGILRDIMNKILIGEITETLPTSLIMSANTIRITDLDSITLTLSISICFSSEKERKLIRKLLLGDLYTSYYDLNLEQFFNNTLNDFDNLQELHISFAYIRNFNMQTSNINLRNIHTIKIYTSTVDIQRNTAIKNTFATILADRYVYHGIKGELYFNDEQIKL